MSHNNVALNQFVSANTAESTDTTRSNTVKTKPISIPLWERKRRPHILPRVKHRQMACGHYSYYLDPHEKCLDCNPNKCNFEDIGCSVCDNMQKWAYRLCRCKMKDTQRKIDRIRKREGMHGLRDVGRGGSGGVIIRII